jgi:hypothetical protein
MILLRFLLSGGSRASGHCLLLAVAFVIGLRLYPAFRASAAGAAHVLQLALSFPVAWPGARQLPGDPGCPDNLPQPGAATVLMIGQPGFQV